MIALLLSLGVSVGGFDLHMAREGSDPVVIRNHAQDAGCVARAAEVEASITPAGQLWLADAGLPAAQHARLQFPVGLCAAQGLAILPDLPLSKLRAMRLRDVDVATCAARPNVCGLWGNDRPFRIALHSCAWRPTDAGTCGRISPDGGAPVDFGTRNTLQPGQWQGAQCSRKVCGILSGEVEP